MNSSTADELVADFILHRCRGLYGVQYVCISSPSPFTGGLRRDTRVASCHSYWLHWHSLLQTADLACLLACIMPSHACRSLLGSPSTQDSPGFSLVAITDQFDSDVSSAISFFSSTLSNFLLNEAPCRGDALEPVSPRVRVVSSHLQYSTRWGGRPGDLKYLKIASNLPLHSAASVPTAASSVLDDPN